jgi:serine protease
MTFGVAKQTTLVAVKVLGCEGGGSMSGVIRGLEFVMNESKKNTGKPHIVNMSLGGGQSNALNQVVAELTKGGVHVVVAAGNENRDACLTSPASEESAMTVGAITRNGELASFSNWGRCVDILSPGTEILSTVPGGKTQVMQGTSMASPAVAGVYALILSENPKFSPETMRRVISTTCSKDVVNRLRPDTINCVIHSVV